MQMSTTLLEWPVELQAFEDVATLPGVVPTPVREHVRRSRKQRVHRMYDATFHHKVALGDMDTIDVGSAPVATLRLRYESLSEIF